MSEKLLKILLSELEIVRITCGCGASIDIPLNLLDKPGQEVNCPGCGKQIRPSRTQVSSDHFAKFAEAVGQLTREGLAYTVGLVVPDDGTN